MLKKKELYFWIHRAGCLKGAVYITDTQYVPDDECETLVKKVDMSQSDYDQFMALYHLDRALVESSSPTALETLLTQLFKIAAEEGS